MRIIITDCKDTETNGKCYNNLCNYPYYKQNCKKTCGLCWKGISIYFVIKICKWAKNCSFVQPNEYFHLFSWNSLNITGGKHGTLLNDRFIMLPGVTNKMLIYTKDKGFVDYHNSSMNILSGPHVAVDLNWHWYSLGKTCTLDHVKTLTYHRR